MNRVCSIFAQMLRLIPRPTFHKAVLEHEAERHARGFTCWGQLVAMLFCHLGQARSLREICNGLAAGEGKLVEMVQVQVGDGRKMDAEAGRARQFANSKLSRNAMNLLPSTAQISQVIPKTAAIRLISRLENR